MSQFHVAVCIPRGGNPTIEHSVAVAMEPYRTDPSGAVLADNEWWSWYRIVGVETSKDAQPFWAYIDEDGSWHCQCHVDEIDPRDGQEGYTLPSDIWRAEIAGWRETFSAENHDVIIVVCKD